MNQAAKITLKVNGREVAIETAPDRSLLEVLREDLSITGVKYGCGEAQCGACTVLLDGKPTFSCVTPVSQAAGKAIITIEGLAPPNGEPAIGEPPRLHPAQQAFLETEAFQCGYCTPGMIIATAALLERTKNPSDAEIVEALNGHLCRCCGYVRIKQAVQRAAELSRK